MLYLSLPNETLLSCYFAALFIPCIYILYINKLGRPRRRWEDNIKMDLQEVGCGGIDWIDMVPDRDRWRALVNAVMDLRVP